MECRMLCDVHGQGGLAHGRPSGDDDQVASMEPGSHLVQVEETRRYPVICSFLSYKAPKCLVGRVHQVLEVDASADRGAVGYLQDGPLGVVHQLGDILFRIGAPCGYLVACGHQLAGDRGFLDYLAVVGDVRRGRDVVHQHGEVRCPAGSLVESALPQAAVIVTRSHGSLAFSSSSMACMMTR